MRNVEMKVTGTVLTITVDLAKTFGSSKSGKSVTIASTDGNMSVPGLSAIKIGLNIFKAIS